MSVPCVILASAPKKGANWKDFDAKLRPFQEGPAPVDKGYRVYLKAPASEDGGNGGGGEPGGGAKEMNPALGAWRRCAWDFQKFADVDDWNGGYPYSMRFEVCLPFDDISSASFFLKNDDLGIAINNSFVNVMIVT